jgi:hypothetical protein
LDSQTETPEDAEKGKKKEAKGQERIGDQAGTRDWCWGKTAM